LNFNSVENLLILTARQLYGKDFTEGFKAFGVWARPVLKNPINPINPMFYLFSCPEIILLQKKIIACSLIV